MTQATDPHIEAALLALIAQRGHQASACPSEVARALSPDDWRALMPRVRQVAGQLALRGLLDISQGGQSVSPSTLPHGPWKGPIRVRLPSEEFESDPDLQKKTQKTSKKDIELATKRYKDLIKEIAS